VLAFLLLTACGDRIVETLNETVDGSSLNGVRVVQVDGRLDIRAKETTDVTVTARLRSSQDPDEEIDLSDTDDSDFVADDLDLAATDDAVMTLVADGDLARVEATIGDDVPDGYWFDVKIVVPQHMYADIAGVSRDIKTRDMTGVTIADEAGSIYVRDVSGDVAIADGSGSISIKDVDGDVYVTDGDGGIVIKHVTGDVTVDDGKGAVTTVDVDGTRNVNSESGRVRDK
jgi:hypothetical protein